MANHQESNPIDDLFSKSFGELPATPAANGWDTPSDRVWQGIQSNLTQPQGWSLGGKLATAATAMLILGAVAYWAWPSSVVAPAPAPTPAPEVQTAPPQPAVDMAKPAVEDTPVAKPSEKTTSKPGATSVKNTPAPITAPAPPRNQVERENAAKPKLPNSVEKNRQQGATGQSNEQH